LSGCAKQESGKGYVKNYEEKRAEMEINRADDQALILQLGLNYEIKHKELLKQNTKRSETLAKPSKPGS